MSNFNQTLSVLYRHPILQLGFNLILGMNLGGRPGPPSPFYFLFLLLQMLFFIFVVSGQGHGQLYLYVRVVLGPPSLVKNFFINNYFKLICFRTTLTRKYCIYILQKFILFTKLTYFDHSNKNVEHFYLGIIRIWVQ